MAGGSTRGSRRTGPAAVPDPEPQPGDDLGAAAAAGLDAADPVVDNVHGQTTMQAAWRAVFLGSSYDSPDDNVPKMDEKRTFLVTGVVVQELKQRMKDGELRTVRKFQVTDVVPAPEGA